MKWLARVVMSHPCSRYRLRTYFIRHLNGEVTAMIHKWVGTLANIKCVIGVTSSCEFQVVGRASSYYSAVVWKRVIARLSTWNLQLESDMSESQSEVPSTELISSHFILPCYSTINRNGSTERMILELTVQHLWSWISWVPNILLVEHSF